MIFLIDFDGTLAIGDTVDALLERYADPSWREIEETWLAGEIDAPTCMRGQLHLVRAEHPTLEEFFLGIDIDPGFHAFYKRAKGFGHIAIVSDGLDYAIHTALRHTGLENLPVFANQLHFVAPNSLDLEFPHRHPSCSGGNGVCKCAVARELVAEHNAPVILIGDGKSDACLAGYADIVFAKGSLIRYCEEHDIPHTPFESFGDLLPIIESWDTEKRLAATA